MQIYLVPDTQFNINARNWERVLQFFKIHLYQEQLPAPVLACVS